MLGPVVNCREHVVQRELSSSHVTTWAQAVARTSGFFFAGSQKSGFFMRNILVFKDWLKFIKNTSGQAKHICRPGLAHDPSLPTLL